MFKKLILHSERKASEWSDVKIKTKQRMRRTWQALNKPKSFSTTTLHGRRCYSPNVSVAAQITNKYDFFLFICFSLLLPCSRAPDRLVDSRPIQHEYNWVSVLPGINISSRRRYLAGTLARQREREKERQGSKYNVVETTRKPNRLNHVNGRVMFNGLW